MSGFNYVIRDNGMPRTISAESEYDFIELDEILKKEYPYIIDSMEKEEYNIEVGISSFFDEIVYKNKVVGFATFDTGNDFEIILTDCYILPEFRGNRLFFNEIEKLIYSSSKFSILQPTRNVVQLLLDYAYAKKFSDDIVISAIEFKFDDVDIKTNKKTDIFENDVKSSNFYDLSICSTIFYRNDEVYYHELLENDLRNYGDRKVLNEEYFFGIKEVFLKNQKYLDQLVIELKDELPNVEFGFNNIIGSGENLSDYMMTLVDDGFVSYEKALDIKNQLKSEYMLGNFAGDVDLNRRLFSLINEVDFPVKLDFNDVKEIIGLTNGDSFEFKVVKEFFDVIGDDEKLGNDLLNVLIDDDADEDDFYSLVIDAMSNNENFMYDLLNMVEEVDDDLLCADFYVDFLEEEDRQLYFDCLLENLNEKYRLGDEKLSQNYPIEYKLYMFNVLKLFKKLDDFILASIQANLDFSTDEKIERLLVENKYIDESVDYENWDQFADEYLTVIDLKKFLKKHNLKVSGKKHELIDRVRENNLLLDEFTTMDYRFCEKGDQYLKDNYWMEFYNLFLVPFDFGDFYRYYNNHEGDVKDIACEYVDSFIDIANQNNDDYLFSICLDIRKLIYKYGNRLFNNRDIFE